MIKPRGRGKLSVWPWRQAAASRAKRGELRAHNEPGPTLAKARASRRSVSSPQRGGAGIFPECLTMPDFGGCRGPYSKTLGRRAHGARSLPPALKYVRDCIPAADGWLGPRLIGRYLSCLHPRWRYYWLPLGGRRSPCSLPHRCHGTRARRRAWLSVSVGQRNPRGRVTRGRHEASRSGAGQTE